MQHQTVHVLCKIGEGNLGFGACQANRADGQAKAVLLMNKEMLYARTYDGLFSVRAGYRFSYRLAVRFTAANKTACFGRAMPRSPLGAITVRYY
jgi:hypothetical protein